MTPKPPWLRMKLPAGAACESVRELIQRGRLHTVCQEAKCPNLWECFSNRTATFLILGARCTRDCGFCAVAHGPTDPPDPDEPLRVAEAVSRMNLSYAVVTSVTRDDLPDGGASVFAGTIRSIRKKSPGTRVEVLIPDFKGDHEAIRTVAEEKPDVLNHNIETVSRLYPHVRPGASYERSLDLLSFVGSIDSGIPIKSGLMLGLGEAPDEVLGTLRDLLSAGCRILTIGQYLQPTAGHLPIVRYVPPEEFESWRETALSLGFREAASGPFVRSSYHAGELFGKAQERSE
jgi:lipoyl synthase